MQNYYLNMMKMWSLFIKENLLLLEMKLQKATVYLTKGMKNEQNFWEFIWTTFLDL